ncbi:cytochrome d ubiquinol oxidase subunit II [Siccirubricoccus sp. KC 17139]|uniref:Cytochrome d ubiquinol oxidase subunit II n=1 Tax=Siccirubricoccus soli TaxID=2899147 RepID=A0ABT1DD80_9PROT|nr:cytochrome d ubiquinol oxidase subunit II [Siccirubricoccus soli]MCO6419893.1 cytochrome d ubiquinol oxidase subunit II [Siccirubricoccus soli]MCP2686028.1 cytochrome d ubiquinol oxidase subunit II [Siccirubricoccus soli]
MSAELIATIWACLIAVAVFLYVCMDGFDLGIGILLPQLDEEDRGTAINTVAPVWDGNETWLVMGGAGLFAVFPLAYATILPALYMPLILMLLALIFRGVAFEMRFRVPTPAARRGWDRAFTGGSLVATLMQGIALGALVQGIKVEGRAYAGGWWDWLTPFSLLTAAALVAGYGLLGACWLVWKTEGALQDRARGLARLCGILTLAAIAVVSAVTPFLLPAFQDRWFDFPAILAALPVPVLVVVLAWLLFRDLGRTDGTPAHDGKPFLWALGLFFLSYTGLGITMWPMMVPPDITLWEAAAPRDSQLFLLVGAAVLIPVILTYTGYVYWLFRGKVKPGAGYH